jgi:hypothetical protein
VKKIMVLSFAVVSTFLFISRSAFATAGPGGIVVVMEHIINDGNKEAKMESPKKADLTTLKGEFAALNDSAENLKLIDLSAGGSADLRTLLN